MRRWRVGAVLVLALVGVLVEVLAGRTAPAAAAPTIIGGAVADPATSGFVAHLAVARSATTTFTCSGALVAPRLVLTAAHCVERTRPADVAVTFPGGERHGAVALVPYTAQSGVRDGAPVDDLAVVQLDRPAAAAPLALPATGATAPAGTPVLELGWGATTPGGAPRADGVLRRGAQVLAGTPTATGRGALLLQGAARTVDGVAGGTCGAGDSGGPLVTTASPPVLLGVVSSAVAGLVGAPTCWSSRVDAGPYRDWLDRLIAQPGAGADSSTAPARRRLHGMTPSAPCTPLDRVPQAPTRVDHAGVPRAPA